MVIRTDQVNTISQIFLAYQTSESEFEGHWRYSATYMGDRVSTHFCSHVRSFAQINDVIDYTKYYINLITTFLIEILKFSYFIIIKKHSRQAKKRNHHLFECERRNPTLVSTVLVVTRQSVVAV